MPSYLISGNYPWGSSSETFIAIISGKSETNAKQNYERIVIVEAGLEDSTTISIKGIRKLRFPMSKLSLVELLSEFRDFDGEF